MDITKFLKKPNISQLSTIAQAKTKKEKKKKPTTTKKVAVKKNETRFVFKPIGSISEKAVEEDPKFIELPNEAEFKEFSPVKYLDFQIQAIRWMYSIESAYKPPARNEGGILADPPGLGKTIDCLGIAHYDQFLTRNNADKSPRQPTLVVATLTLLHHWQVTAVNLFGFPEERVLIYHGTERYNKWNQKAKEKNDPWLIITNYETIQKDNADRANSRIYTTHWSRVMLDEAHEARNPQTATFRALKNFKTNALWCVTANPIWNDPADIRVLSCLCTPNNPLRYGNAMQEMIWKNKHMLRREKAIVGLPPITIKDVWLDFLPRERESYRKVEGWAKSAYDDLERNQMVNKQYQKILLLLVRLRQACDHILLKEGHAVTSGLLNQVKEELGMPLNPFAKRKHDEVEPMKEGEEQVTKFLVPKKKKKKNSKKPLVIGETTAKRPLEEETSEEVVVKKQKLEEEIEEIDDVLEPITETDLKIHENQTSGKLKDLVNDVEITKDFEYSSKMIYILEFLQQIKRDDPEGKTVIFTQFATMLDLIEIMLLKAGFKLVRFDGRQQNIDTRKKIVNMFTKDPQYTVLLASLKAGGVGLTLTPARYLINVDPWWNKAIEGQAFNRIHRISQTHPVLIIRLLIKNSIEEEVLNIQKKKDSKEAIFFNSGSRRILSDHDIQTVFNKVGYRQNKIKTLKNLQ